MVDMEISMKQLEETKRNLQWKRKRQGKKGKGQRKKYKGKPLKAGFEKKGKYKKKFCTSKGSRFRTLPKQYKETGRI